MGKNNDYLKHFEETDEKDRNKCLYCKTIMMNNRSYNMKKHLIRHGIDCLSKTQRYKTTHVQNEKREPRKYKRREVVFPSTAVKIEMSQTQLIRAYIGLVAEDNVPLHVLDSPNFKHIIDPICTALSEKTGKAIKLDAANCEATINLVADVVRDGIKSLIKQRLLAIKVERGERVLSNINTFFISTQFICNDELKSYVLGVMELKDALKERNFIHEVSRTLHKYDIKLEQIIVFTTAFNTHLFEMKNETKKESAFNDIALCSNAVTTDNIRLGDYEICTSAARIAEQCAMAIINDDEQTLKHLHECQKLAKYIRETTNEYDDVFEMQNLKFLQSNSATNWCTNYAIISEILAAKEVLKTGIQSSKSELGDEKIEITDTLWDFMDCYCTVLSPLHKALQKFQEEHMHIGNFYAQWLKCQILTEKLFEKCDSTDNLSRYKLCERAVEHIKKCTQTLLSQDSFNACLYMDPRFQHTLDAAQRQKAISYLKKIWDRLESSTAVNIKVEPNMEAENIEQQNKDFSDDEDEMLNSFLAQELKMTQNKNLNAHLRIENLKLPFLRSEANILQFWNERKDVDAEMYALSNACFGIPATQVSIEREAPNLKTFVASHENGLELETLENILLVKFNPQYLDEAIEQLPLFECEAMEEDD